MITLDEYFDKIFIINLNHRLDKWDYMKTILKKNNITNYEKFPAIKPTRPFLEKSAMWRNSYNKMNPKNIKRVGDAYIIGAMGCKMSHYNVMKLAKANGYKRILILEDDATFVKDALKFFNKALEQINRDELDWHMLYFYGKHKKRVTKVADNLSKLNYSYNTCAYAVTEDMYDIIINDLPNNPSEIDVYYASQLHSVFNCYCVTPHIVYQKDGYSDILQKHTNYKK